MFLTKMAEILSFNILIFLINCISLANSNDCNSINIDSNPVLLAIKPVFGTIDNEGVSYIEQNDIQEIQLMGYGLNESTIIGITALDAEVGTIIEDNLIANAYNGLKVDDHIVTLSLGSSGLKEGVYYICIKLDKTWVHQGNHPDVRLVIEKGKRFSLVKLIILLMILLTVSGLFSGLTLGLMSLDRNELSILIEGGTESEKRYATIIKPVRERGSGHLIKAIY